MRNERKILRLIPQKLRKSFANGNPSTYLVLESIEGSSLYFGVGKGEGGMFGDLSV